MMDQARPLPSREWYRELITRDSIRKKRLNVLPFKNSIEIAATIGRTNQWSRGSTRSSTKSVRSSIQYRSIFDDVPILSHQSLLALSSAINIQVAQVLGSQLGLPYEDIMDIKSINQPPVVTIFEILWEWRGKVATPDQVEQLVKSFNQINQKYFADVILKVNREKRGLTRKDFQ